MLTQIINGRIFTPQGWLNEGSVLMRDGKILEVTNCDLALIGARLIDAKGMYIVPGFVCMARTWWWWIRLYRMYGRSFPWSYPCTSAAWSYQLLSYPFFFTFQQIAPSCRNMRKTDGRTRKPSDWTAHRRSVSKS